ncbi:M-phase inducer phosphatase-like isoform X2 [Mizuhopecten yessoensis]|uniref:M-phase inducer phosphatase-like isoform X2 n=1 Tax=Mizuhopecten yessoensis TaxID=6573 RepID=UPI000B45D1AB|nr:M-phase inducer phosphatase-like isoform X2 [Mizuhopecten yessoensis]
MKSNRSRSRISSHSEHVVTPSVRKSLLQDFLRCDEPKSLMLFVPVPEDPDGSCLELLAPTKKQQDQPEDHISTAPKQSVSRVRRSLSFGAESELNLALMEAGSDDVRTMVEKLSDNDCLIGDGSASHCLPTVAGQHVDIKSVSSLTLSEALRFGDKGRQIRLVDCRYPYEYKGGHIQGAESLYTHEQILGLLEEGSVSTGSGMAPQKLVFYCEFSSVRAPSMYRFLREKDRALNMDKYPALIYPEIYLLDGGYQAFFQSYKELCTPSAYLPMRSQSHLDDLRHFRTKSKSWAAGEKRRLYLKCLRL